MRTLLVLMGILLLASSAFAQTMAINYVITGKNKCGGVSPAIKLTNVPPGTDRIRVEMKDLDVPSFNHWNNTFKYEGDLPEGKGVNYYGPCPPSGKHTYRVTASALDATGKVLASASKETEEGR
ncbi:MAG TPA: hypothetical protein VN203_03320 [Candidatus Acidoferrum sp.]|nr:hypothetical protein [Candidatus Acidoferrum sp.]